MTGGFLDIPALQDELRPYFRAWDAALKFEAKLVRRARRDLMAVVWARLREIDVVAGRGIYAFADPNGKGLRGLHYIGCAAAQSLEERVAHYLRNDCSLDAGLSSLSADEAVELITNRLAAMPNPDLVPGYAAQHLRTRDLIGSGGLFFARCEADPMAIEGAEGALVATSWALGAPLRNAEVTRLPSLTGREEAVSLALRVIEAWASVGFPSDAAVLLSSQLI